MSSKLKCPLSQAISDAISASPLSLTSIHRQLLAAGIDCTAGTPSNWKARRSRPQRLATLIALMDILGLSDEDRRRWIALYADMGPAEFARATGFRLPGQLGQTAAEPVQAQQLPGVSAQRDGNTPA
jgi:hypothetical protein